MTEIEVFRVKRGGDEHWSEYRVHLADESAVRLRSASALRQNGATLHSRTPLPQELDRMSVDEGNDLLSSMRLARSYHFLSVHHGAKLRPEDFARISDFPELTTILITTLDVGDEIAEMLAKLSALEVLCVYSSRLSDRFLLPFTGHKSIRLFDVQNSPIGPDALQTLAASLPSLEKAYARGVTFGKSGLPK